MLAHRDPPSKTFALGPSAPVVAQRDARSLLNCRRGAPVKARARELGHREVAPPPRLRPREGPLALERYTGGAHRVNGNRLACHAAGKSLARGTGTLRRLAADRPGAFRSPTARTKPSEAKEEEAGDAAVRMHRPFDKETRPHSQDDAFLETGPRNSEAKPEVGRPPLRRRHPLKLNRTQAGAVVAMLLQGDRSAPAVKRARAACRLLQGDEPALQRGGRTVSAPLPMPADPPAVPAER